MALCSSEDASQEVSYLILSKTKPRVRLHGAELSLNNSPSQLKEKRTQDSQRSKLTGLSRFKTPEILQVDLSFLIKAHIPLNSGRWKGNMMVSPKVLFAPPGRRAGRCRKLSLV